jgi:hypothetical protein
MFRNQSNEISSFVNDGYSFHHLNDCQFLKNESVLRTLLQFGETERHFMVSASLLGGIGI